MKNIQIWSTDHKDDDEMHESITQKRNTIKSKAEWNQDGDITEQYRLIIDDCRRECSERAYAMPRHGMAT